MKKFINNAHSVMSGGGVEGGRFLKIVPAFKMCFRDFKPIFEL